MKIRPAREGDALPMARVFVDTFIDGNIGTMSEEWIAKRRQDWPYEMFAQNWQKTIEEIANGVAPLSCIYVAEDETGAVVGFALTCPSKDEGNSAEIAELDLLYVNISHHRQGIGRALVQATAAHLVPLGVARLHILTPVGHVEGRKFYDRLGGRVVGTRDDYDDGELIPLVIYEWTDLPRLAETGMN